MNIHRVDLPNAGEELDTVVVIDVIRAFTTTAFAFEAGAKSIILIASVEEAFSLKNQYPDALLMGELDGYPIEGFDYGNSPSAMLEKDISGKLLIHRTSAGTQGAAKSSAANAIYATGLCNARATAMKIREALPESLTFVVTGIFDGGWGEEDIACADYIYNIIFDSPTEPLHIVKRVSETRAAKLFNGENPSIFPPDDLEFFLDIDRFDFVMTIEKSDGHLFLQKGSNHNRKTS